MSTAHWVLIVMLAVAAFAIRLAGLFAGTRIKASRHAWVLEDVPGLIVVSLVAASLAGQPVEMWLAAAVALAVAVVSNHVIATMCVGVAAFAALAALIG
ncbi:AzlD domain-containing protein [Rhodobacteraceae bacterium D3-12]|nr:AzlD domain-containing protein [Rhodobacteraceae bacterium D3-12]